MVRARTVGGGDIAFLTGHAPFIGALATWTVEITLADGTPRAGRGARRVRRGQPTTTSRSSPTSPSWPSTIDADRARRAQEAAEAARAAGRGRRGRGRPGPGQRPPRGHRQHRSTRPADRTGTRHPGVADGGAPAGAPPSRSAGRCAWWGCVASGSRSGGGPWVSVAFGGPRVGLQSRRGVAGQAGGAAAASMAARRRASARRTRDSSAPSASSTEARGAGRRRPPGRGPLAPRA